MTTTTSPLHTSAGSTKDFALSDHGWRFGLCAVTVLALVLRLTAIDYHSFWYDEAVTAKLAEYPYWDLFTNRGQEPGNPPLYWLMARAWSRVFGKTEVALRSFSLIFGVCTVPLLAFLGQRLLNRTTGLIAAGLLAISAGEVELSNEAKVYALLHFLVILNVLFFVRWVEQRRWADLAGYGVTMVLSCYGHYYAVLLPLAHLLTLAAFRATRALILPWFGCMVLVLLCGLPWLPAFLQQLHSPGNLSRGSWNWPIQFAATPVALSLGRTFAWRESPRWLQAVATLAALLGFVVPAVWGVVKLRNRPFPAVLLSAWLLVPILVPLLVALTFAPIYLTRYSLIGLPAFLLLIAYGLPQLPAFPRAVTVAVLLGATAVSLVRYNTLPLRDDWRSAEQALMSRLGAHEPVVFDTDYETTTFKYYNAHRGTPPETMWGITGVDLNNGTLMGIKFENAERIDPEARPCTEEILATPSLWLALCVPQGSAAFYDRLMQRHGYTLTEELHFQRIDLFRYSKTSPAKRE